MVSCITMCGIIDKNCTLHLHNSTHSIITRACWHHPSTQAYTHADTHSYIKPHTRTHTHTRAYAHTHARTHRASNTHTHYICFVSMLKLCLPSRHFVVCLDQLSRLGTFHSSRYRMLAVIHLNMTKGDSSNGGNPI